MLRETASDARIGDDRGVRVTWGMEDPAARAREQLSLQADEAWGRPPRRRRSRESLLIVLFIALAAGAIWWTVQREDEAAGKDPRTAVLRGEVVGLSGLSLARPVNLAPLLARMRAMAGPRDGLLTLHVAPTQVTANLVTNHAVRSTSSMQPSRATCAGASSPTPATARAAASTPSTPPTSAVRSPRWPAGRGCRPPASSACR